MAVVFAAPPSIYANPTGSAIGIQVKTGSTAGIIVVAAEKTSEEPGTRLSQMAQRAGGTPGGEPASINAYLRGYGIITGIRGSFSDAISIQEGTTIIASVNAKFGAVQIQGVCFHEVLKATTGGCARDSSGRHGIESILAYFEDNRISNTKAVITTVKIGTSVIKGAVTKIQFAVIDEQYNIWGWIIHLLSHPNIVAGLASQSEVIQ